MFVSLVQECSQRRKAIKEAKKHLVATEHETVHPQAVGFVAEGLTLQDRQFLLLAFRNLCGSFLAPETTIYTMALLLRIVRSACEEKPLLSTVTARRVLVAASMIAMKIHQDEYYTVSALLKAVGITPTASTRSMMASMELLLLQRLQFAVHITSAEYHKVANDIENSCP